MSGWVWTRPPPVAVQGNCVVRHCIVDGAHSCLAVFDCPLYIVRGMTNKGDDVPIPVRDWKTVSEVAAVFGVSSQAVRLWTVTGQLCGEQTLMGTWLYHDLAIKQFRHNRDTQPANRRGGAHNRPSVRKPIDPDKTYRVRSTGERITGAELLRRRAES